MLPIADEKTSDCSTPSIAAITEAKKTHTSAVRKVAEDFSRSATKTSSPGLDNTFTHV